MKTKTESHKYLIRDNTSCRGILTVLDSLNAEWGCGSGKVGGLPYQDLQSHPRAGLLIKLFLVEYYQDKI